MRPSLTFSNPPTYSTAFCEDPWPEEDDSQHSASSHVLPESAFLGADGRFLIDPYFGKEAPAHLCSGYLIKTFHCQDETASSRRLGQPALCAFIAQLLHLTNAPSNAVLATLILLQRFQAKLASQGSVAPGLCGHMLWLGAFIIACREESMQGVVQDANSAAYWSELTLFSEREVDEICRELWDALDGNVTVFPSYASALEKLKNPIPMLSSSFESLGGQLWEACDEDRGSLSPRRSSKADPKVKSVPAASLRTPRAVGSRLVSFFKKT